MKEGKREPGEAQPSCDQRSGLVETAARRWFNADPADLHTSERRVLRHTAARRVIARRPDHGAENLSVGQRRADRVAAIGGSWTFIAGFGLSLLVWAGLNTYALARPFDPYPFIFLNLLLSMLAAIQAPVIMMSQNRQAAKDRATTALDYEVNLKAEIEIMALHDKLDRMRDEHLVSLLKKQQEQIDLLTRFVSADAAKPALAEPAAVVR